MSYERPKIALLDYQDKKWKATATCGAHTADYSHASQDLAKTMALSLARAMNKYLKPPKPAPKPITTKLGAIPIYTETSITEPGWYWFVPLYTRAGGMAQFLRIDQDVIETRALQCRRYAGRYAGPIEPPMMACREHVVTEGHACANCGATYDAFHDKWSCE